MECIDNQIVVSIQCLTYNHAPYIRQCLEGFVMQKTNFRFEAIVHDDASTDGTQDIIREYEKRYPDIIKPIYQKENQYSKGIPGRITNIVNAHCKGKYIAICEGDDYWIDPLKLQKQVDVMEKHPECSICFGKVKCVNREKEPIDKTFPSRTIPAIFSQDDFMRWEFLEGSWVFQTSCFLFRTDILTEYSDALQTRFKNFPHVDLIIQLYCLEKGNGCYISDHVSCYRVDSGGYNSYLETNKSVAIKTYERKILGLKEYNKATNYKFHHELNIAILGIEWGNERLKNCKHGFFSSKYIPLYKEKGIKETLIMLMSYYTPTLLNYLVNLKKKINGKN